MTVGIAEALVSLRPNSSWYGGPTYESIVWLDSETPMPTEVEIEVEILRLQQIYNNNEYQRLRSREYPSWEDQMDLLYHVGYDGWKEVIKAVKDKYPKPV